MRGLTLLLLGALACGPAHGEPFLQSFRAGQRAYSAGRYEQAAKLFEAAAADAERVKDRDEALFLRARMFERLERWKDAQTVYRRILAVSPDGPRAARAAYEHATLEIEHGDAERGWTALAEAVKRFPSHGSASRAIELWAEQLAERRGEAALRLELEKWLRELEGTDSEQRLECEIARSFERSGEPAKARDAFLRAARDHPYPKGNLTDDAYYFAAESAEAAGDPRGAIAILEELLKNREVAALGGSYERPRYPSAQMRIAELHRELGEIAAARAAFRRTHENHRTSTLADDAIWQEALMARRLNDRDGACAALEALKERYPDSRYQRCLALVCPDEEPSGRCPRYIAKTVD